MSDKMEIRGVNHIALVTDDMAKTTDFYANVLEMPLIMALDMGGHGQHFFFDCGNNDCIAFFQWGPDTPKQAPGIAARHEDTVSKGVMSAHGSMNHIAVTVPLEAFDDAVARLRAKGVKIRIENASELDALNDTGWVRSAYFMDPNGIAIELAAYKRALNAGDVSHAPLNEAGKPVELNKVRHAAE